MRITTRLFNPIPSSDYTLSLNHVIHEKHLPYFLTTALEAQCISSGMPGRVVVDCQFNSQLESVVCSYDGGAPENCSFPLVFEFGRFGPHSHTVVVNVVDVFGRSINITQFFTLGDRE